MNNQIHIIIGWSPCPPSTHKKSVRLGLRYVERWVVTGERTEVTPAFRLSPATKITVHDQNQSSRFMTAKKHSIATVE